MEIDENGQGGDKMTKFFVMKPDGGIRFGRKWAYADLRPPVVYGNCQYCPVCGDPVSGMKWLPPYQIKLSNSRPDKWGDTVWGAGFELIVSERFKNIYEREGLTGIAEFSPAVEVVQIGTKKIRDTNIPSPIYHSIHIPWGGADMDDQASGLTHRHPEEITCNYCRTGVSIRRFDQLIINEGTWNGTDIFIVRNSPGTFVVSDKFKYISEKNNITNIWLIPSEKYACDEPNHKLWYVRE